MKRATKSRSMPEIGVVALPVMCALLAGLVFATSAVPARPSASEPSADEQVDPSALERAIADRRAAIEELLARIECAVEQQRVLAREVSDGRLAKARANELAAEAEALAQEIARLHDELDALDRRQLERRERINLLGDYAGPYVLLEIDGEGATVHPGGTRLPTKPTAEDLQSVWGAVDSAKFVALAVRPAAFEGVFDTYRALTLAHVESAGERQLALGFSYFPLAATDPIERYLPKETLPCTSENE